MIKDIYFKYLKKQFLTIYEQLIGMMSSWIVSQGFFKPHTNVMLLWMLFAEDVKW